MNFWSPFGIFARLKKGIAILLATCLLLAQTPLQQMLKLPALFIHFQEHQQHHQLSVGDFIAMHYLKGDKPDQDHDNDMKLPFKRNDIHFLSSAFSCVHSAQYFVLPIWQITLDQPISDEALLPDPVSGSVFQPPRMA